ncbi:hypothetical protein ACKWTF_001490 [Chironomus riparius]
MKLTESYGILIFFILHVNLIAARQSEDLLVNTTNGAVLGRYMKSDTGRTIRAFMGIPYAEPPVSDLRFRPPQPKKSWKPETLSTQNEPPKCAQLHFQTGDFEGQEDCLYLNVYAPEHRLHERHKKFPVMVWIHGGSLITGHGGISEFGPDYFLDTDVILVTGNYRLSIFGFLSTEDENMPGNYGLKDQVAILKWVNENIEDFGGDRDSVTLFGESSGGVCVNYHMISQMSQNLFHRGISQSGTLQNFWADPDFSGVARERAIKVAEHLNCTNAIDTKLIVECLREKDVKDLANTLNELFSHFLEYSTPYLPVMENVSQTTEEPFITSESFTYNHRAKEIPWLVGINSEEGAMITVNLYSDDGIKMIEWNDRLPKYTGYDHLDKVEQEEIAAEIKDFYFNNEDMNLKRIDNITNLFTDGGGYFGMFDVLNYRFQNSTLNNTYIYLYSHKGAASHTEVFGRQKFYGTCHMDELLSLFPLYENNNFYTSIPTDFDRALHRIMPHLWANFASTG